MAHTKDTSKSTSGLPGGNPDANLSHAGLCQLGRAVEFPAISFSYYPRGVSPQHFNSVTPVSLWRDVFQIAQSRVHLVPILVVDVVPVGAGADKSGHYDGVVVESNRSFFYFKYRACVSSVGSVNGTHPHLGDVLSDFSAHSPKVGYRQNAFPANNGTPFFGYSVHSRSPFREGESVRLGGCFNTPRAAFYHSTKGERA